MNRDQHEGKKAASNNDRRAKATVISSDLRAALNATWQAIGYDILEANGGKDMRRSHVIEVVLDANYLEMYGGQEYASEIKAFRALPYEQKMELAKQAFTFERYGM